MAEQYITVLAPDGTSLQFPVGTPEAEMRDAVEAHISRGEKPGEVSPSGGQVPTQFEETTVEGRPLRWRDVPLQAVQNIPESGAEFLKGVWNTVRHPVQTASALSSAVRGGMSFLGPTPDFEKEADQRNRGLDAENARRANRGLEPLPPVTASELQQEYDANRAAASGVAQFYKERYGSPEGFKYTAARDPLGFVADIAAIGSFGAGTAAKVPALAKASATAGRVFEAVDPVNLAVQGALKTTNLGYKGLTNLAGAGTIGGEQVRAIAGGGAQGRGSVPERAMRGITMPEEVVETGLNALSMKYPGAQQLLRQTTSGAPETTPQALLESAEQARTSRMTAAEQAEAAARAEEAAFREAAARQAQITAADLRETYLGAREQLQAAKEAFPARVERATEGVLPESRAGAPVAYEELAKQRDEARANFKNLYKEAEASGDVVLPQGEQVNAELAAAAKRYAGTLEGGEAEKTERIVAKLNKRLQDEGQLTFADLNSLRRQLQGVSPNAGTDYTAARDVIRQIDDIEDAMFESGRLGDSDVVQKWRAANDARRQFAKDWEGNVFERALEGQDPQAITVTLFGTASGPPVRGPNRAAEISAVLDRLSPEAKVAVQQDAMDRLFSKDVGKTTFGRAFRKWERENPELAALLVPPEARDAVVRARGDIALIQRDMLQATRAERAARLERTEGSRAAREGQTEAERASRGREAAAKEATAAERAAAEAEFEAISGPLTLGQKFISTDPTDFARNFDAMTPDQRQNLEVSMWQRMRKDAAKPETADALFKELSRNEWAQANLRTMFGDERVQEILRAAEGAARVREFGAVTAKPGETVDSAFRRMMSSVRGGADKQQKQTLLDELDEASGGDLKLMLAGMEAAPLLNPNRLLAAGTIGVPGVAALLSGNPGLALATLPLVSPRIVGEAALAAGRAARPAVLAKEALAASPLAPTLDALANTRLKINAMSQIGQMALPPEEKQRLLERYREPIPVPKPVDAGELHPDVQAIISGDSAAAGPPATAEPVVATGEAGAANFISAPAPGKNPAFDGLVDRVIAQESGGNHEAVSPKGAKGLMQIMGHTARDPGMGVTPLRDDSPEENVRFGRDYLYALIQKFNGDEKLALMSYNWGPGNLEKWLSEGADPARVPEETRNYIKRILGKDITPDAKGYQQGGAVRSEPAVAGNIDLHNRPVVKNADGSISTVRSITVGFDDKTYVLPTVVNGRVVSDQEAIAHFRKTGEHLGAFNSLRDAEAYSQRLHQEQAAEYAQPK